MLKPARTMAFAAAIVVAIAACNSETVSGTGGLAFEATSAIVPGSAQTVSVTATITNISSGAIDVNYGSCAVIPVLHIASVDGTVAYDPRPVQGCPDVALSKTLQPDEAFTITGSAAPKNALVAGKYYVEAVIAVNGETVSVGAGTVTF